MSLLMEMQLGSDEGCRTSSVYTRWQSYQHVFFNSLFGTAPIVGLSLFISISLRLHCRFQCCKTILYCCLSPLSTIYIYMVYLRIHTIIVVQKPPSESFISVIPTFSKWIIFHLLFSLFSIQEYIVSGLPHPPNHQSMRAHWALIW